jgi:hypothetical protein
MIYIVIVYYLYIVYIVYCISVLYIILYTIYCISAVQFLCEPLNVCARRLPYTLLRLLSTSLDLEIQIFLKNRLHISLGNLGGVDHPLEQTPRLGDVALLDLL